MRPKKVEKLVKRPRKAHTLEEKMEIINRLDRGEKPKSISHTMRIAPSTICTIYKMREQIQKRYQGSIGAGKLRRLTRTRHAIFENLEKYLVQWVDSQSERGLPLSTILIRQQALKLFTELKEKMVAEGDTTVTELEFKASPGWFDRFKIRSHIGIIKLHGEAGLSGTEATAGFPAEIERIVEEGGYTPHQIFNIDETGLFWKRMPSRTLIARDEAKIKGHKPSKDRLTLLLGGNCAGDVKLKPMLVYHSENPRALKGIVKSSLPVIWKANRKAWVTQDLFSEYVYSYMSPFITEYTKKKHLPNKALLILDNAPAHPATIMYLCENIQVAFLPPNTSSLLQPMEQGAIRVFKSHYVQLLMLYLARSSDADQETSLIELWKQFNIRQSIEFIDQALKMVTQETMNGAWKKLLPKYVADFHGFDEADSVRHKIVTVAQEAGIEGMEAEDINELLSLHSEELTLEEMLELEKHRQSEEDEEEESSGRVLDIETLKEILNTSDYLAKIVMEKDPDMTRGITFKNALMSAVECYRTIYEKKFEAHKQTLSSHSMFFRTAVANSSEQDVSQPSTSGLQDSPRKRELSEISFPFFEVMVGEDCMEESCATFPLPPHSTIKDEDIPSPSTTTQM